MLLYSYLSEEHSACLCKYVNENLRFHGMETSFSSKEEKEIVLLMLAKTWMCSAHWTLEEDSNLTVPRSRLVGAYGPLFVCTQGSCNSITLINGLLSFSQVASISPARSRSVPGLAVTMEHDGALSSLVLLMLAFAFLVFASSFPYLPLLYIA